MSVDDASDAVAPDAMTGLAVDADPITDSAKGIEQVDTSSEEKISESRDASIDAPQSPVSPPQHRQPTPPAAADAAPSENGNGIVASGPTPPRSEDASPKSHENSVSVANDDKASPVKDEALAAPAATNDATTNVKADSDTSPNTKHALTSDSSDPPAKRARTDDGSGASSPAIVKFAEPDPERKMTQNRQKYCLQVLRQLKRSKDAPPFLQPVDPIKLKIPDYLKIVTNPQDLGTIETKLKKNEFNTIDDFIDSVNLVWTNCQKYNGPDSAINQMALRLKEQFERQIRSMPAPEPDAPAKGGPKGKKTNKAAGGTPLAAPRPRKSMSPVALSGVPPIRRESMGLDGRPKREIHAPPPKSLPYQTVAPKRGKNLAQLKFCGQVLKELTHKRHEQFAFPFYQPVDARALGLHDYHTVIKHPMDLATMQQKLSAAEYESADDFEYDMRLMFRNCFKYNGAGTPVNAMGKRLEAVFSEKWAEKPIPKPGGYGSDSDDDSGSDDASKQQTVHMLTKQLEAMQEKINSINSQKKMNKKKKPKRERFDDDDDGGMGPSDRDYKSTSKKGGRKGRDANDVDESPFFPTFEQKTALSNKMGYMSDHQMPVVIQILKRTEANFDPEDEEVELDVDKVHPRTLRLLWNWIMMDIQPSFMREKPQKAKKSRVMLSETESQRQIDALEAQIHNLSGGGGDAYGHVSRYGEVPNDDSSDSDASSEEEE